MNAFFEIQEKRARLLPIEVVTLGYTLFTALLIFYFWPQMEAPWRLLMGRAMIIIALGGIWGLNYAAPCEATRILRNIFPLTILGYWYSDTYEFNRLFDNLDYIFAAADYDWFGSQPSLVFRQLLSGKGWSELFHFGYFSYFPMIVTTTLLPYFVKRDTFERYAFIIIASFFLYYVVFLFLPAVLLSCRRPRQDPRRHFPATPRLFPISYGTTRRWLSGRSFPRSGRTHTKQRRAPHGGLSLLPRGHQHAIDDHSLQNTSQDGLGFLPRISIIVLLYRLY